MPKDDVSQSAPKAGSLSYVTFENLNLKYSTSSGFLASNVDHIMLKNVNSIGHGEHGLCKGEFLSQLIKVDHFS